MPLRVRQTNTVVTTRVAPARTFTAEFAPDVDLSTEVSAHCRHAGWQLR